MKVNSPSTLRLIGVTLLTVICSVSIFVPWRTSAQNTPDASPKDGRYYEGVARQAYRDKNFAAFLENMQKAAQLRPNHPRLTYNLAVAYALNGRSSEALAALRQVAEMGLVMPAGRDPDFDSIKQTPEFSAIIARIDANRAPTVRSTQAFSVNEKGVVPEGLAYDPNTATYYLSSIYKRKIISINSKGEAKDFATEREGLWSVFGMRVDPARRVLWACTAAHPQMSNYQASENGISGVYKFDLRTGKLIKKYLLPNTPKPHLLGDLVLDAKGNVFASDSTSAAVYQIRKDTDEIELFLEDKSFVSPQGLAFTPDGKGLFLADYSNGLFLIDVTTKKVTNLAPPVNGTLLGIDGLYFFKGDLIAIQNGVNPWRLVRLKLNPNPNRVERIELIEANNPVFDEPTLGVLVNTDLFFIANSQWETIDQKGQLAAADKLKDPVVLKLKL